MDIHIFISKMLHRKVPKFDTNLCLVWWTFFPTIPTHKLGLKLVDHGFLYKYSSSCRNCCVPLETLRIFAQFQPSFD